MHFHSTVASGDVARLTKQSSPGTERVQAAENGVCYNFGFVTEKQKAKRFYVSGFVQGVGFRYFVRNQAARLRVHGYTRNLSDGRVEVYALGTRQQLTKLREALHKGPRMARVREVEEAEVEPDARYEGDFVIVFET
jgi:acylphosphatase